jgi:hypothetical protein
MARAPAAAGRDGSRHGTSRNDGSGLSGSRHDGRGRDISGQDSIRQDSTGLAGPAWAGWFRAGGDPVFLRVERPDDSGARQASLPGLGWFGVPVTACTSDGSRLELTVTRPGLELRLTGAVSGDRISGQATCDGQAGEFELLAVSAMDEAQYRLGLGHYAGAGREVSLHLQSDDFFGEPVPLYLEGSDLVRLHPAGPFRFVSERAEIAELDAAAPGSALTIGSPAAGPGQPARLDRAPLWTEQDVVFPGPAGQLAGTLMTPLSRGPHAAIALLHGAGGGRRDLYRIFGEQFARAGLAALIFDKRGHGASGGDAAESTMAERSRDAEAALDFLAARPGIAAGRAGLYGFSNGTWSVAMVAGRRPDLAFVVVMGAPGVTPAASEVHRKVFELREQGVPADEGRLAGRMWELIYRFRRTGQWDQAGTDFFDEAARRLRASPAIAGLRLQQYAIDEPFLAPVPPYATHAEVLADQPDAEDTDWSYDPVPDYRRSRCPVLFVVGELDQNLPGPESARRAAAVLDGPGHAGSVVRVFPGTGHLMNLSDSSGLHGMTTEEASYRFHRFRFAPGFLELLRSWSAGQAGS